MDIEPISLSLEELNKAAEDFLDKYHPAYSLPVPIEDIIDLKLQIDIIPIFGLKSALRYFHLDIDGFIATDFKSISVDEVVAETFLHRYRFTLAHEIAHRQLHGYFYEQFKIDSINDWKVVVNQIPEWPVSVLESQANMFAGMILVPRKLLKLEFIKARDKTRKLFKEHNLDSSSPILTEFTVRFLTETFDVSGDCIRRSLNRDRLRL